MSVYRTWVQWMADKKRDSPPADSEKYYKDVWQPSPKSDFSECKLDSPDNYSDSH